MKITVWFKISSVTYPAIWRCHDISRGRYGVSYGRCGCKCGGLRICKGDDTSPMSPERDAVSPAGYAVSPEGYLLASPNFGICDTTPFVRCWMVRKRSYRTTTKSHKLTFFATLSSKGGTFTFLYLRKNSESFLCLKYKESGGTTSIH